MQMRNITERVFAKWSHIHLPRNRKNLAVFRPIHKMIAVIAALRTFAAFLKESEKSRALDRRQ